MALASPLAAPYLRRLLPRGLLMLTLNALPPLWRTPALNGPLPKDTSSFLGVLLCVPLDWPCALSVWEVPWP